MAKQVRPGLEKTESYPEPLRFGAVIGLQPADSIKAGGTKLYRLHRGPDTWLQSICFVISEMALTERSRPYMDNPALDCLYAQLKGSPMCPV
jgi:hypothetical protein